MYTFVSSRFNYYFFINDEYFVYNTLSMRLVKIDREVYQKLQKNEKNISDMDMYEYLKETGNIVSKDIDELKFLEYQFYKFVYEDRLDVTILPTQGCNFNCIYCFEEHNAYHHINDENEKKLIRFFNKNLRYKKSVKISWFGGEPLLEKNRVIRIMKSVNEIAEKYSVPIVSEMITNGFLLTKDVFDELIQNNILFFEVTIDGLKDHHNRLRPCNIENDSFGKICQNLVDIQKNSKNKFYRVVIRTNVDNLSEKDYLKFKKYMVNILNHDERFVFLKCKIVDWGGEGVKKIKENLISNLKDNNVEIINTEKNYSVSVGDIKSIRCNAGKENGFVISYDLQIFKCSKMLFNATEGKRKNNLNKIGYISDNGQLVIDEVKNAKFLSMSSYNDKCRKCCWLPICVFTKCPIDITKKELKCYLDNNINDINIDLYQRYKNGYFIDLSDKTK